MNKPVVFRVTNNLGLGGVQRRLSMVLPRLTEHFEVHVVTYRDKGPFFDELPKKGVHTHFLPIRGKWSPSGLKQLADLFRQHHTDIVHTHSLGGNITGILAAALAGVPVRIGQVHLSELHWYGRSTLHRKKQMLQESLVHRLFSDRVLFVSKESLNYFKAHTGLPESMLTLLHNGVDFSQLTPRKSREELRAELGLDADATLAGFVGRLAPGKGVEFFIDFARRAVRENPQLAFVAVGGGEKIENWREDLRREGLADKIRFVGPQQNMADWYACMDAFVFTSEAGVEGMPGVVLEAASQGLPIISRDIEPVREVSPYYSRIHFLRDGEVPHEAIEAALSLPEDDLSRLYAEFDVSAMAKRTMRLYGELLEKK